MIMLFYQLTWTVGVLEAAGAFGQPTNPTPLLSRDENFKEHDAPAIDKSTLTMSHEVLRAHVL
jgi:hypothetical protein